MPFNKYKYNNDYNSAKYDRLSFLVPKGDGEHIKTIAKNKGYKSVSEYINALISENLNKTE